MWTSRQVCDDSSLELDDKFEESGRKTAPPAAPDAEKQAGISISAQLEPSNSQAPDGGYGWVCALCVALLNAQTWGISSAYGVFLAHYLSTDGYQGATHLQYALVGGLSVSCAMLISPLATLSVRYFGTHVTLFVGTALEVAGFVGASFAHKIWHLFLTQGVAFGIGMGLIFVGTVGIPAQWFTTKRSLANGIGTAGSGFGGVLYSVAVGAMIRSVGIAWCFRVLGLVAFGANTICIILIRDRNKIIGSRLAAFDVQLFKRPEYLLLNGYGFFSVLGYIALVFSLAHYAEKIGLSASQASVLSAILNLGQGFGRPAMGYLSDNMGRINVAGMATMLCAFLSFIVWTTVRSYGALIFFALASGSVAGTFWATAGPVAVEVVGIRDLPSALNLEWLIIVVPCTVSEPIALAVAGKTGNYLGMQLFIGSMYTCAALCLLFLRGWKMGELDEILCTKDANVTGLDDEHVDEQARLIGRRTILTHFWKWRKV